MVLHFGSSNVQNFSTPISLVAQFADILIASHEEAGNGWRTCVRPNRRGSPGIFASSRDLQGPFGRLRGQWLPRLRFFSTRPFQANLARSNHAKIEPSSDVFQESLPKTHAATPPPTKLSHINSSGEAHMIDVGDKLPTRRTAIACAFVKFSNSRPVLLISENSNKKGDVLGVARIAGLAAAKRTSDLIPLCHPVMISKVRIDIMVKRNGHDRTADSEKDYGQVAIEARVDCVGPTGVEMEAMTAALVAALTVYDMCKAVDKAMVVSQARVLYKAGGKSGTFVDKHWKPNVPHI